MNDQLTSGSSQRPKFRRASCDDIIFIARLLREFYRKAGEVYGIPYDHESTLQFAEYCVTNQVTIVGPSSCAAAVLCPFPSNKDAVIAQVLFWYFHRPREVTIFEALARECQDAGATHINASSHYPDNKAAGFYVRAGMGLAEIQCVGPINKVLQSLDRGVKAEA